MLLGYGRTGGENLLSTHVYYDPSLHEIDKKLALLSPLGITGVRPAPKIWLSPEEIAKARQFVAQLIGDVNSPMILMDPGAKPIQRWPLERYIRLAGTLSRRFHQAVLVSAGPLYSHLAEELVRGAGEDSARFVGSMGLRDLMALVAAAIWSFPPTPASHTSPLRLEPSPLLSSGHRFSTRFWHGEIGSRMVQSPEPCCSEELHETCLKSSNPVPGFCMEDDSPNHRSRMRLWSALSGLLFAKILSLIANLDRICESRYPRLPGYTGALQRFTIPSRRNSPQGSWKLALF